MVGMVGGGCWDGWGGWEWLGWLGGWLGSLGGMVGGVDGVVVFSLDFLSCLFLSVPSIFNSALCT